MFVEKISTTQCKLSENVRKQKDGEQNHAEREQKVPAVCGEVAKGGRRVQFLRGAAQVIRVGRHEFKLGDAMDETVDTSWR